MARSGQLPAGGRGGQAEEDGHGASDQAGRPEGSPPRRILPANVPAAGIGAAGRARALEDLGARQAPVGREALELHLEPRADPDRDGLPGQRRPAVARPVAADLEGFELANPAGLLIVDGGHPLVRPAGTADPHGVGAEIRALLAGLPVHEGLPVAPGPALLVGLVHQHLTGFHHLAGHREGNPVVVGHEVVAGSAGDAADRRDRLGADLLLHEGDEPLGEDAVHLSRHGPDQLGLNTNFDVMFTGLAMVSPTGDLRSIVSLHLRTFSSEAGLLMVTV